MVTIAFDTVFRVTQPQQFIPHIYLFYKHSLVTFSLCYFETIENYRAAPSLLAATES